MIERILSRQSIYQRHFETTVEPLHQAIGLWMEIFPWRVFDSKEPAMINPDRAYELSSIIGGDHRWNSKGWIQDRSKTLAHSSVVVEQFMVKSARNIWTLRRITSLNKMPEGPRS